MKKVSTSINVIFFCLLFVTANAQPLLQTGGKQMPDEWIDINTHHKIIKVTRDERNDLSFYFNNDPFAGNSMVYYSSTQHTQKDNTNGMHNPKDKQLYLFDMVTRTSERLTNHPVAINGEIVSAKRNEAFYQVEDSIFSVDLETRNEKLLYVFPPDFKGDVTTVNADGTLLGGVWATDEEKNIQKNNPEKHDYFNKIFDARLPRTLFIINIETGVLSKLFTDSAWLNHVQFSPTDPALLMFCHEGPWQKVDRIWTININSKEIKLIHKRTMPMEIAGHEWFDWDGKTIWFDLQQPRGVSFYVAGVDIAKGEEKKYELQRNEWSVHYTTSQDGKLFAGDGGDPSAVAKAEDGKWIYLFTPAGNRFISEKLVDMKNHNYHLEPNVHFIPDGKWIIFRANFEGKENIYAVEVKKSP